MTASGSKPHVLINSLQRSGGTLVARLLDGHPAARSLPFELLYAPQKVRFPLPDELAGMTRDWENFKAAMLFDRNYERIAARRFFSKDAYSKNPLEFDYPGFEAQVRAWFEENGAGASYAAALSACLKAFFDAWLGPAPAVRSGMHVNHLSMMCYASPQRFFELLPEGRIVQSLRDPYSWYASMKRHFGIADMNRSYMTYALGIWVESTLRGIAAAHFWPEHYALLRYGDLVSDCECTMKRLAAFLGLEFDPIVLRPTLGGREWLGNSSFRPKSGVDVSSLQSWRQRLTADETAFISDGSGAVGDLVAGGAGLEPAALPSNLRHPTSGRDEPLAANSIEELLANESRRMSLLTYQVFTRTLQREHGERYRKKETIRDLVGRALRRFNR